MIFNNIKPYKPKTQQPIRGLGDIIKKVLDVAPVPPNIRIMMNGCGGCGKRQETLNALVPNPFLNN